MALDGIGGDALERFEAANTLPPAAIGDLDTTSFAQALRRSIVQQARKTRPWWQRFALPAAIVVALGAGWTFYSAVERPVSYGSVVLCYNAPRLDARVFVTAGPEDAAVASCSALWQAGRFGKPQRPALVECVGRLGFADVFPRADPTLCQRLDLANPSGGPNSADAAATASNALQQELSNTIAANRCLTPHALTAIAEKDLRKVGLSNWHIDVANNFGGAYPCAGEFVLPSTDTLRIVPEQPLPTSGSPPSTSVPSTSVPSISGSRQ
jgi:hypothetical protein